MPTVAEVLKAANVKDEVVAGLPPEVVSALNGYVSTAETTLKTAEQKQEEAAEALRQAGFEKQEIENYVKQYGDSLTETASVKAQNEAMKKYLESLKAQGFDVTIPGADSKPAVPGSPAGVPAVDENKIINQVRGEVGSVFAQYVDANNEHIRLYGQPIPDSSESVAAEAARARKPVGAYLAEKYKFAETRKQKEETDRQKDRDAYAKTKVEEALRLEAEKRGSNPNLRAGESSRNSVIPIKHDDFEKATGNVPRRERLSRMLDNVHKDVAAARSA